MELTHVNENGEANMVDVGEKPYTKRTAKAQAIATTKSILPNKRLTND